MKTCIKNINGTNRILVDGKPIDSLAFKSFRPTVNNVGDFYKAGVRIFHPYCTGLRSGIQMPYSLYGELWFGDNDYRFEGLDKQMEMFLSVAPDAYFIVNLQLDTRQWWLDENPGNVNSFTHLSQISANEKWREDTRNYIRAFIEYAENKYGDRILGYWLLAGYTTEWFSFGDKEESHPVKLKAFREYMGDENIEIPTEEQRNKPANQIFLDPKEDETLIKYRRFSNELNADVALDFCKTAKEQLNYSKLIGLSFGYILELGNALWQWGHLELDKVNQSPYVDMIGTPTSYKFRNYDDGTAYMLLSESVTGNHKMHFASFDNLTFLTPTALSNPRRLCDDPETTEAFKLLVEKFGRKDLLNTREKTIHGMRREMMARLYRQGGTWWFDMLEGWYYDEGLMAEVKHLVECSKSVVEKPCTSAAEICVFVGKEPLYYVNPKSSIHIETVCQQRGALSRIGAPYELRSLSEMEKVDKNKYKLFIFLNAFSLSEKERKYINETLKGEGRSLLFVGYPDYINAEGKDIERTSALLEMNCNVLEKDEVNIRGLDLNYGYETPKNPTFYVEEGSARVLGRFADSRKCGLAVKEKEDYKIFYSSLGNIHNGIFREIAKMAGVHIYCENGVFTYINSTFAGVYNTGAEETVITLKTDGKYRELFSGKIYETKDKKITLPTGECPAQMLILE
ncbi:MAG: hypothetical protein IJ946_04655 [Clostridia bacterium]|nr:hypothetical protein [Clostridia bacterium]